MDKFERAVLEKIDKGEKLSERELDTLVFEYEIEIKHGENLRWSRINSSIVCLGDRYFLVNWEEGLTEHQENGFYYQPVEVEKQTYEKTITVTEWVPISK